MSIKQSLYSFPSALFSRLESVAIREELSLCLLHNNPDSSYSVNAGTILDPQLLRKTLKYFELPADFEELSLLSLTRLLKDKSPQFPFINGLLRGSTHSLLTSSYNIEDLEDIYIVMTCLFKNSGPKKLDKLLNTTLRDFLPESLVPASFI